MIDIHAHLLFGVDDGPKNEAESLKMLQQTSSEGITEIICTSHAMHPQYHVNYSVVEEQTTYLQQLLEEHQIPIKLHTGHEVRLHEDLHTLIKQKQLHTLANSNYILLELSSSTIPAYTRKMIILLKAAGYTPILAHPERNYAIREKPTRLEILIQEGALTQITAGSLIGFYGKEVQRFSLALVRANYIHTFGSDVHNVTSRPFFYKAALNYLEKQKELDAVDQLLKNNELVIANKQILPLELDKIYSKKWWRIF
ncbi:tyrosine-protein phosphatase [Lysinibacillus sp. NPDC093190]|uniref:tyrosine-protein phosphatase n=1 Tax=Lysinibacillus sp. NPDC093190 TaxID=3390575 RepID=UPI003D03C61A